MKLPIILVTALGGMLLPAGAAVYAHYSFDDDFTDSSGNGRHGTLTDVGTTGNSGITKTAGGFVFGDGAMDFSDDPDYISLPSKTFSSGLPYTIAFWAQRDSNSHQWNMTVGDQSSNFFIALRNDGILRWRSSNSTTARQQDFAAAADTAWHHYAIVASGTNIDFYRDGSFVDRGTNKQTGFIIDGIGSAYSASAGFDFRGRMDEVWIFDEALEATAISNLEAFNSIVPEPGTIALGGLGLLALLLRRRR